MRKRFYMLLIVIIIFFDRQVNAQVYNGNLSLFTQAQVDAFNYTEVTGHLMLDGSSTITNFDGLSELTTVGEGLYIGNIHITNLDGLSNLTSVGGRLSIHTKLVTNLNALSNLTHAQAIYLFLNDALTDITGLSNITNLSGDLSITNNTVLSDLSGLSNLLSVQGDLIIKENAALTNLDGLSKLKFVVGELLIENSLPLTNINGLSSLEGVGSFNLKNAGITNLDGLTKLTDIDVFSIVSNAALIDIDGLTGVTRIPGRTTIKLNSSLTNIDGLSNVTEINGPLEIQYNDHLENLDGLVNLVILDGALLSLSIIYNPLLTDYCGLSKLFDEGTIQGSIQIGSNGANTIYITPPPDITLYNDPGQCSRDLSTLVPYNATVTGCLNPSPPSRSDYPPGNIFPVGTTNIVWSAYDGAGHAATAIQYITIIDNQPPAITCPSAVTVQCAANVPAANIASVTASDNCDYTVTHVGDVISNQTCANRFTITRTYKATDGSGNTAVCSQIITVNDNVAPQITGLTTSKQVLAPPNHKMVDITLDYSIIDNCVSTPNYTVTIGSNESVNGTGDGDTDPDWEIVDNHHIRLRAERAATGTGRIYTITITADDGCNPPVTASTQVVVAHNITGPHSGQAFKAGSTVSFSGEFWDKPGNKHSSTWVIDQNLAVKGSVTEPSGNKNGKSTGSYKFTNPGVYKLQMNIKDQNGVITYVNTNGDLEAIVVIYDPNGGYTYGGGYFNSPAGALVSNSSATGKASYGFAMNYFKNSTYPKGETQFEFKVGEFEFNALNFEYLAINSSTAQFKGTGKIIGGQSGVGFTMTVVDGQLDGSGVDKIRMKIYNKNNGIIIYDNQPGASEAALPTQAVGANSVIVIQGGGVNNSLTARSANEVHAENKPTVINELTAAVYPNPASNYFNISVRTNDAKERIMLQVFDQYGRLIEKKNNVSNESVVRLGDLYRPGIYYVRIIQGKQHKELKLVKLND